MEMIKKILLRSLILIIMQIPVSFSKVGQRTPSEDGMTTAGPYYNPVSKSYFELFRMQTQIAHEKHDWPKAKSLAEKKFFKNTQGRLAIVRDLDTHQFMIQHFSAKNYWIGLQYFCGTKMLKWIDGSDATQNKFSAWDSMWSNSHIRCGNMGYMPIHYTTATYTKSLRWRASGPKKFYLMYMVEYPTGKE